MSALSEFNGGSWKMLELRPGAKESAWTVQRVDSSGCSIWHALVRSSVSDVMQAFVVFLGNIRPTCPASCCLPRAEEEFRQVLECA